MSAYEAINLMLEFGIFILTLLALIVTLIKHFSNKKQPSFMNSSEVEVG